MKHAWTLLFVAACLVSEAGAKEGPIVSRRTTTVRTISPLVRNRRGRPYSANKLREKKLRPLLTRLRMPLTGFHAFRHAVASELIDSGAPITVVQAQLRHSDPRITLGLYGHVIPQSQRDAVGSLAARLANKRRRNTLQLLTRPRIADSAA